MLASLPLALCEVKIWAIAATKNLIPQRLKATGSAESVLVDSVASQALIAHNDRSGRNPMNADNFRMPCPQLDLLRRDLIEAYRSLEDRDVFVVSGDPKSPCHRISQIHESLARHRQSCPICNVRTSKSDQSICAEFVRQ